MNKLSRNDLCWCGSGKKYKKCHMKSDMENNPNEKIQKLPSGIIIKNKPQIAGIKKCGELVKKTFEFIEPKIKAGITTEKINQLVHEFTLKNKGIPAPLNYNGFPKSVCTSVNEVICHGIPSSTQILKDGDIVNIDITTILDGFYADSNRMFIIGNASKTAKKLVEVAEESLRLAINEVKPGNHFGDCGAVIQEYVEKNGFSVVRDYCGHGVGLKFHEPPQVLHYGKYGTGDEFLPGMTFTIEPMINEGKYQCRILKDNWTAVTKDGSLSAQWEHTVCVTETGVEILT